MTSDTNRPGSFDDHGGDEHPNVSPDLQDAIRSIDAIGENAWGKDDDEDAPRGESPVAAGHVEAGHVEGGHVEGGPVESDPSLQASAEVDPDTP